MLSQVEIEEKVQEILNTFFKPMKMSKIVCYSNSQAKVRYLEFGVILNEISLRMTVTKHYVEVTSLKVSSEAKLSVAQDVMNNIIHVISSLGVVQSCLLD